MRAMMWFRADLRISDNRALAAACDAANEGVIAVFVVSPRQWEQHDWGAMRIQFMLRNVRALAERLADLNIPLLRVDAPTFADAPQALLTLAQAHHCSALYFNDEYEVNELERDAAAEKLFAAKGLAVKRFCDQTVLDVSQIRTGEDRFYSVFTPFQRAWRAAFAKQGDAGVVASPRKQRGEPVGVRAVEGWRGEGAEESATARPDLWPGGELVAQKRLAAFVEKRIAAYGDNRDFPGVNGTSIISPYLAVGAISPRQCVQAALDANDGQLERGASGVVKWISEVVWREFYRHVLIGWPRVCRNRAFKPETENIRWEDDERRFEAWAVGRTGIPIVDAGMRQLAQTGWMHNRVRMIVAMYLAKDLFLDWRRGEAHFMRHLVDGDFASNNGGWQWSASTGTDAAPYFRIFNPMTQAEKFDPDAEYIRRFVPELASLTADQIHADPDERLWPRTIDYPRPLVDRAKVRDRVLAEFQRVKGG